MFGIGIAEIIILGGAVLVFSAFFPLRRLASYSRSSAEPSRFTRRTPLVPFANSVLVGVGVICIVTPIVATFGVWTVTPSGLPVSDYSAVSRNSVSSNPVSVFDADDTPLSQRGVVTDSGSEAFPSVTLRESFVVPRFAYPWLGMLCFIVGLIGSVLFFKGFRFADAARGSERSSDTGSTEAFDNQIRWSWLFLPGACFAVVVSQALSFLTPLPRSTKPEQVQEFAQRQERMLKIVKDYVQSHRKPELPGDSPSPQDAVNLNSQANRWITAAANGTLEPFRQVLVSGQFSSVSEAENELLPLVAQLVQDAFHHEYPWQGDWVVPLAVIRERVIEYEFIENIPTTISKFQGDLYRTYVLVNLSPEVLRSFESEWKYQIVTRRLAGFGVIFTWIFIHLAVGWAYFQKFGTLISSSVVTTRRWRWKFIAIAMSLAVTQGALFTLNQLTMLFST